MHIVRNAAPLAIPYNQQLPPGEWLMQDDTAFGCAARAERGTVALREWDRKLNAEWMKLDDSANVDISKARSILLIRSGAIGDLLLLSPCIEPLRKKYLNAEIWLACFEKHWPITETFGAHMAAIRYPVDMNAVAQFDLIISLENIIEQATEKGIHATDAFAEALGVTVTDCRPVYRVTDEERERLTEMDAPFHRAEQGCAKAERKPRVALNLHASSKVRGYPMKQWNAVLLQLLNRGWEIMLLGDKDGIKGAPPAIKDCSDLTFREAAAVLASCDVFCGVDSAFFNLCPALGVPAIGLFGPVDWITRIKEGSGQLALTTHAECAPCGWTNARGGRQWPAGMPCEKAGTCVPLAEIPVERIIAKIDAYRK